MYKSSSCSISIPILGIVRDFYFNYFHGNVVISHVVLILISLVINGASQVELVVKYLSANAGDGREPRFSPWVGKVPWRRKWQPTLYSCLENPMGRGAWIAESTEHACKWLMMLVIFTCSWLSLIYLWWYVSTSFSPIFCIELFGYLSSESYLYILDTSTLSVVFWKYFMLFCDLTFHSLDGIF